DRVPGQLGDPVADQDEGEQRDRQAGHPGRRPDTHPLLDLALDPGGQRLEGQLQLGRAALGRAARHVQAQPAHDGGREEGGQDGVDVQGDAEDLDRLVGTRLDASLTGGSEDDGAPGGGDHISVDHFCRISLISGSRELAMPRNWNTMSPPNTAMAVGWKSRAQARASTVMSASRPSTAPENWAREGWVRANLSTERIVRKLFSSPSARPTQPNSAYPPRPMGASTAIATAATTTVAMAERRNVARVTGGVYPGTVSTCLSPPS